MEVAETIKNLIGIEEDADFKDNVILAVEGAEKDVIVSHTQRRYSLFDWQVYEDSKESPIIGIQIKDGKIAKAWEA